MSAQRRGERLRQQGNPALARDLEQLADHMRRRVDRELIGARVRTGARPRQARANVGDALRRLPATLELVGNLLENAAKWAGSRVEIRVSAGDTVRVSITDDGLGVPAEQLGRLGERGLRLDERKAGSGLGLAIARDVADAYGGVLDFARADSGGLAVTARLPAAPPEPATSQPPRKRSAQRAPHHGRPPAPTCSANGAVVAAASDARHERPDPLTSPTAACANIAHEQDDARYR